MNCRSNTTYGDYAAQQASCLNGAIRKAHAATTAGSNMYCYDQNGNMDRRLIGGVTYNLTNDAENRLTGVTGGASASFTYDGDGNRVKGVVNGVTTTYIGNYFEWTGSTTTMKSYYYSGSVRVAMRIGSGSGTAGLKWLLSDYLGSTSVSYAGDTGQTNYQYYTPWGSIRPGPNNSLPTDYTFTGQKWVEQLGLMYYNSRWYDHYLNRWIQPDPIIPDPYNPLDYDRFSYVRNNPLNYVDPTGNRPCDEERLCNGPVDEFQLTLGRTYEGEWDTENQEAAQKKLDTLAGAGKFVLSTLWEPADWAITATDCINGDCSPFALVGLLPIIPSSGGKYIDDLFSFAGHHTVPRQILKILPSDVSDAVRGVKGAPNIWQIPESLHKIIHSGPGPGGYFNAVWRKAVEPLLQRGNITPQEIFTIRDQLANAFGLWKWKP